MLQFHSADPACHVCMCRSGAGTSLSAPLATVDRLQQSAGFTPAHLAAAADCAKCLQFLCTELHAAPHQHEEGYCIHAVGGTALAAPPLQVAAQYGAVACLNVLTEIYGPAILLSKYPAANSSVGFSTQMTPLKCAARSGVRALPALKWLLQQPAVLVSLNWPVDYIIPCPGGSPHISGAAAASAAASGGELRRRRVVTRLTRSRTIRTDDAAAADHSPLGDTMSDTVAITRSTAGRSRAPTPWAVAQTESEAIALAAANGGGTSGDPSGSASTFDYPLWLACTFGERAGTEALPLPTEAAGSDSIGTAMAMHALGQRQMTMLLQRAGQLDPASYATGGSVAGSGAAFAAGEIEAGRGCWSLPSSSCIDEFGCLDAVEVLLRAGASFTSVPPQPPRAASLVAPPDHCVPASSSLTAVELLKQQQQRWRRPPPPRVRVRSDKSLANAKFHPTIERFLAVSYRPRAD